MSCHLESSDIFSRCHVVLIVGPLAGGERQEVGGHLDNVKELPGVFRHEVIEVICRDAAWRRLSSRGTCPGQVVGCPQCPLGLQNDVRPQ